MCAHSVTFSRSPLSAPLAPAADPFQELVCVKTSGEAVMETLELLLVTCRKDLASVSLAALCVVEGSANNLLR